jgi:hypothetical protein
MIRIVIPDEQKNIMELDDCYREVVNLSVYMAKRFYPENEEFHPLDSTSGVISQIDNMVTGLRRDYEVENDG